MKIRFSQLQVGLIGGVVLGVALVVLAFTRLTAAQATAQAAAQGVAPAGCDPARSIRVSGSATINVVPDRAQIDLGIQSNDTTAEGVQAKNLQASQAVIASLRALGIDQKDIATDNYMVEPIYSDYQNFKIQGYRIDMIIGVTVRDPSMASQVLVTAFAAGANRVINVDFSTTELRKYRDEARALALKAAKDKAELLTANVGTSTGCVLAIEEGSNHGYSYSGWLYNSNATQNTVQNAANSAPIDPGQLDDNPISLGQIAVSAEVSVEFGLR